MSDTLLYALEKPWKQPPPATPARPLRVTAASPSREKESGPEPPPGALTGRLLKHYRVGNRIAGGGMGEVYVALDTSLNRPVAIKTIRSEPYLEEVRRALFARGAQAQAKVVHPHVVQVYYAGEDDGVWFVAMQLVDGGSLADLLAHRKRLSWQEAARHMLAVAEGLAEAARVGVIHRDVKPANVLLDRAGRAHVADFGLASLGTTRPPPNGASAGKPTPVGMVLGTLEYMAPEQLRGGPVDSRADMYSLGATFYHLLAGKPPLTASSLREAAAAHLGPAPRPLRRVVEGVPRALARIVDRCLRRDRELRFRSFDDLVRALRRAVPPPEVPARAAARVVAWAFDLVPAALVLRQTYATFPAAALAAELALVAASVGALGATPGEWLVRLRLRVANGEAPSPGRAVLRALLHCGWLLPLGMFLQATYGSARHAEEWGIAAVAWLAASAVGSLFALFGARDGLHDWLSGVRVVIDTR